MIAPVSSLPRRERERLQRRSEILAAARSVFAQRGYAHATLDEVAEQAELGKGTLYNYFPDGKHEILLTLVKELFLTASNLIRDHFAEEPSPPSVDSYHRLVAKIVHFYAEDPQSFLLYVKEIHRMELGDDPSISKRLFSYREPILNALSDAIEQSIDAGILRPSPSGYAAHILFGVIHGYVAHVFLEHAMEGADSVKSNTMVEEGAAVISDILFNGLKA